jgi:hypothetical protein
MISYYELLGLVKEGKAPKKIKAVLCSYSANYVAQYDGDEFSFYQIEDKDSEDCNYKFYLSECFLEDTMFKPCIKVLQEMELKEDMFVRDNCGEIHYCIGVFIDENNPKLNRFENEYGNITMMSDIVGEPSYRVMDLIRVGDLVETYVNGLEKDGVTSIKRIETLNELQQMKIQLECGKELYGIITKEKIHYSYRVGE